MGHGAQLKTLHRLYLAMYYGTIAIPPCITLAFLILVAASCVPKTTPPPVIPEADADAATIVDPWVDAGEPSEPDAAKRATCASACAHLMSLKCEHQEHCEATCNTLISSGLSTLSVSCLARVKRCQDSASCTR